jgi:hypothetical protein
MLFFVMLNWVQHPFALFGSNENGS